jgi:hypothetical protein
MDVERTPKEQLPYPYNQDLSQILHGMNRRTVLGRERLANDPMTAAFLAAAMRLIGRHLRAAVATEATAPQGDDDIKRPTLNFLSQRAVVAELAANPEPFERDGTVATMRDRWKSQSDFLGDVISFALWTAYYPKAYSADRAAGAERLAHGPDFARAVENLTFMVTTAMTDIPSFRLQLVATATAEDDDVIRRALANKYHRGLAQWKQVYAEFLAARGLRLRPGITLDELTNILTACVEGCALRALSDPEAQIIDRATGRSLLGTAALALLNGCVEPIERPAGKSIAEAVDAMVYHRDHGDE